MITEPSVVKGMSSEEYHADPCPTPSLSKGVAHVLLEESPLHARAQHPRLNPNMKQQESDMLDAGSLAHALLLENGAKVCVIDPADYPSAPKKKGEEGSIPKGWTNNAIREARDEARANGLIPVLPGQHIEAKRMVESLRKHLKGTEAEDAFVGGDAEVSLFWQEIWEEEEAGGEQSVWMRARLDWKPENGNVFYDYKTTGGSANPAVWSAKTLWETGAALQAAFYSLGISRLMGINDPVFRFVVQENFEPFAVSIIQLDPAALAIMEGQVDRAIAAWEKCLRTDVWPGYCDGRIAHVSMPGWKQYQIEERNEKEEL